MPTGASCAESSCRTSERTQTRIGRLTDRLSARFGRDAVFRDLDSISPGKDFTDAINMAIEASDTVLVVIGRNWLTAERPNGTRRLDDPGDFVRIEIAAALERQVQVIPVLVDRARMPSPDSLPDVLVPFGRRNALELSESRWDYDVGRLIEVLDPSSPETVTSTMRAAMPVASTPVRKRPRLLAALGTVVLAMLAAVVFVPRGGGHKVLAKSTRDTTTTSTTTAPPPDPKAMTAPAESRPATGGAGGTPAGARPQGQASQVPSAGPQPSANQQTPVPAPQTPTPTNPPPPSDQGPAQTADAVAGSWSGTTVQGFQVALVVRPGCGVGALCGSISVSGEYHCKGDFTLYNIAGGTYEFNVDNFTSDSSPSCYPGAGEYLTPQGDGTLAYTTNYGPSATLYRS